MNDDFDRWNMLKKSIDKQESSERGFPREGEVWWCYVGKNIGQEQNGGTDFLRPVLILKKFNNEAYWTLPLTSTQKNSKFYVNFNDSKGRPVSVIISQIKLTSRKRFKRMAYTIEEHVLQNVRKTLLAAIKEIN